MLKAILSIIILPVVLLGILCLGQITGMLINILI